MTEENQTEDTAPQEESGTHTPDKTPVEEKTAESEDKAAEETPVLTESEPQSDTSAKPKEKTAAKPKAKDSDDPKVEKSERPEAKKKEEVGEKESDEPKAIESDKPKAKTQDEPKEEAAAKPKAAEEPKEEAADKPKAKSQDKPKAEESEKPAAKKKEEVGEKDSVKEKEDDKPKPEQETAADLLKAEVGDLKIRKAKRSKNIVSGIVHILATFNNTMVTFTDKQGNVISWSSSGKCNFRGSRKSTAYAAQIVTQDAGRTAMSHGLKEVEVRVKGPGMGRDSAVRALQTLGLIVTAIVDVTPVPHNGCRPPKRRRV